MKVGDLVVKKRDPTKILGIIIRLFSIDNRSIYAPLPMVEIMTSDGVYIWKRRKVEVASENR